MTTAVRDGDHFILNGTKKWITNSVHCDYITALVRTGKTDGPESLSMLLVEKGPDVVVRAIPTDYSSAAGTGLISFENCRVPVKNLIGKEGEGMKITMHNFNLERCKLFGNELFVFH